MGNLYHYNHLSNLTPPELLFWVAVDKMLEQIGGQDVVAAFAILSGQPIVPTRAIVWRCYKRNIHCFNSKQTPFEL